MCETNENFRIFRIFRLQRFSVNSGPLIGLQFLPRIDFSGSYGHSPIHTLLKGTQGYSQWRM